MVKDPICGINAPLEDYCGIAKTNKDSKGMASLNWILVAITILINDVLLLIPAIQALFPSAISYFIANLAFNVAGVIIFFFVFGIYSGISLVKLIDSLIIFVIAVYYPPAFPIAYWIELFPAFFVTMLVYYLVEGLHAKEK
jgi:hypothetical protein